MIYGELRLNPNEFGDDLRILGFDVADEHEEDSNKDKESDFRKDTVLDDVVKDKESDVVKDNVQDVVLEQAVKECVGCCFWSSDCETLGDVHDCFVIFSPRMKHRWLLRFPVMICGVSGELAEEEESFDIDVYDTYTNLFSIKMHYAGRFTDCPNKQYVEGETCFVDMIDIGDFNIELVNIVLNCIGYEDDDDMVLHTSTTLKKFKSSRDEEGEGDSESEDGIDFVDEEHLLDEVEVNMKVLDFDSLESDQDDENAIVIVQKVIEKSDGPLTPAVTKLFNKIKEAASECTVDWNGSDLFQVKGIPCKHVIVAIHDMTDNGMDVGTPKD
ncbi:hypothetical protein Tco_0085318 [Tanacetum coccineum]